MKIDLYTKAVLTVIAIALMAILLKPALAPSTAHARDKRSASHAHKKGFKHIQVVSPSSFFDMRSGVLYVYEGSELSYKVHLDDLGGPLQIEGEKIDEDRMEILNQSVIIP